MENKYYLAFISYKREDEKWARWLQRKLEHYHIPIALRKSHPELPKNLRPIFKDTTDLSGGVLETVINEALEKSQYLIVICSPRAAKSEWVCKEVQKFIELGKEEKIIPFIVDGAPFSNEKTECFPPALKVLSGSREILGINVNDNGQEAAAVKVVSRMLNLNFDTLWQRFRREQRRRIRRVLGLGIAFVLFLIWVIVLLYNKNETITKQKEDIESQKRAIMLQNDVLDQRLERIQKDSILLTKQKDSITQQKQELANTNASLVRTNSKLVQKTNVALINQANAVAPRSIEHTNNGDAYLGRLIALEILPKNLLYDDRPLTIEAEHALRYANLSDNARFIGHTKEINALAISSDGRYLASGASDNKVIVWDRRNANKLKVLEGHEDGVVSVQYSKDDKYLLTASGDNSIILWDAKLGTIVHKFQGGHTAELSEACFGPKSTIISGDWGGDIVVWDIETENILHKFKAHDKGALGIEISTDSNYLVTKSNAQKYPMKIWNADDYSIVKEFPIKENCSVDEAVFSPDSKLLLATLGAGKLKLYSTSDWEEIAEQKIDFLGCESACFSPDNQKIALGSTYGHNITVLSTVNFDTIGVFRCDDKVRSCVFSPDGQYLLAGDNQKKIYSWHINNAIPYDVVLKVDGVKKISVSNSRCLVLTNANTVLEYHKHSDGGLILQASYVVPPNIQDIYCINDGVYYSVVNQEFVDYYNNKIERPLPGVSIFAKKKSVVSFHDLYANRKLFETVFENEVQRIAVSQDISYLAVANTKGVIFLYNLESGQLLETHTELHERGITTMSFSKESTYLLTSDYGDETSLYHMRTKTNRCFNEHTNTSYSVFGDNRLFATYSDDGSVIIWDSSTKKRISFITGLEQHSIRNVSFFDYDNRIIVAYKDRVGIWDTNSGSQIEDFEFPNVSCALLDDATSMLYLLADGTLMTFRYPTLQELIDLNVKKMKGRVLNEEERKDNYLLETFFVPH